MDDKLDAQGNFTLMGAVVAKHIACANVAAAAVPGRGVVDQDFVYLDGRLIMAGDPDFDSAAIACDLVPCGGNSADANDNADS